MNYRIEEIGEKTGCGRDREVWWRRRLARIFHTGSTGSGNAGLGNAGSGDPAYRDWAGDIVGRVPARDGMSPLQTAWGISGLPAPYVVSYMGAVAVRLCLLWLLLAGAFEALGETGDVVAVVYNRRVPESRKVAEYYAEKRRVPSAQIFGFDLPEGEAISRREYREQLEQPLLQALERQQLLTFRDVMRPATALKPAALIHQVVEAKIRYVVLCYGVPARILAEPNWQEPEMDQWIPQFKRNEAAVDNELCLLPASRQNLALYGMITNPYYNTTNATVLNATNGLLMVARLDGPSAAIARGLVDKAMQAETDGLWGRAYIDARGLTNGPYKMGDDWMRGAAEVTRKLGYETVLDEKPETFPAAMPLSHVAFYAGWYDSKVSGPFLRKPVEFMPGAFAYHLYSFSAHQIRSADGFWVGPLLAQGATITMGCVDEPYLQFTPNIAVFAARFLYNGFSFGEAAYASLMAFSWQTTVIGDPLYRPRSVKSAERHADLLRRGRSEIEWSHLAVVNGNLATESPAVAAVAYLEQEAVTRSSAVLQEKLGDLYEASGKPLSSLDAYAKALKLNPSSEQSLRLLLTLARKQAMQGRPEEAIESYRQVQAKFPEHPGSADAGKRILELTEQLKKPSEAGRLLEDIRRVKTPKL